MTLDDLGNLGEFVGAIGVVLSLIYLAAQIRQNSRNLAENTKALRLSEEGTNQQNFSQFRHLIIANSGVAALFSKGLADRSSLEPTDQAVFNLLMDDLFFALQLLYQRVQMSVIPDCRWANDRSQVKAPSERPDSLSGGRTREAGSMRISDKKSSRSGRHANPPPDKALQLTAKGRVPIGLWYRFGIEHRRFAQPREAALVCS